ncbi:Hypothetical protein I595_3019 [Croceitalea dokdonensis DOKDO 023]|uniref:II family cellulose-binding protein n=1 Tax=Croceitalea dokdonensis DOKDO 023 TaxID=1300341 RepID=A0A0P7A3K1_9FLAO|nr:DUF2721 domain-containing protein [Croceitalea dokdonensis]KPM31040.1 Hypothetical protein I595_3019 [Croceitalea dokdonensis DOKDO 023]
MQLTLSIPALLFPAISLTMLAYNARYLAIAGLIRQLHKQFQETEATPLKRQIGSLRKRLEIIKNMQATAIVSFLLAAVSMFLVYVELSLWANIIFGISLVFLMVSLVLSLIEVQLSTKALGIQLKSMSSSKDDTNTSS